MNKANSNKPLISVILPVYRSEKFLENCLNSLSKQSYKNIEIVAIVDYLGDESLKILRKHKKTDKRLRIYSNLQRYGLASTLNRAIRLSKGTYIAFMDSTGVADPRRLSLQFKFLKNNPKIAVVGSHISVINDKNRTISSQDFPLLHEDIYKHLIGGETFKFESAMVAKTRLPKDIFRFRKDKSYPFVYADVFVKMGLYKELANLPEKLLKIRDISSQKKDLIRLDKKVSYLKLLFESTTIYEYKPSLRSLFTPIIKQI
jgi:glycosyltransferase involved in cell wall biosynthesis